MRRLSILLLFWVFFTGCSNHIRTFQHYQPIIHSYDIPSFDVTQPVDVVNNQYIKTSLQLATSWNGYRLYADLNQWTATAVSYVKAELAKRSMPVNEAAVNHGEVNEADKEIKIAITNAYYSYGQWFGIHCHLSLRVETSEGYIAMYQVDDYSPTTVQKASNGAIIKAVVRMLSDEKIIGYLLI